MNSLDFSIVAQAWPYLCSGLLFSLALTAAAFVIGMILGTCFALVQHFEVPVLTQIVRGYIALIRSIPLILVLFCSGNGRPVPIGATWTAFITFGLFEAAYYSEIIRVGLRAVNRGQFEACQALALSTFDTYRCVILPQVIRVASPIILSQTIILFQDTSLVYVLSLTDLLGAASKLAQLNGRLVEMYLVVAVVYLAISSAASQCVASLRKRYAIAGMHR
jgi:glutamate/aspartate transport system permease protein